MRSVYIHIPFCEKICSYCDFCKIFYNENIVDRYLEQLEKEVNSLYRDEVLETIYIGGGTPSCLNINQLKKLFKITDSLKKSNNVEFTIECNFSSTNYDKLVLFKEHGINRLSFGLESIVDKNLEFLERKENKNQIIETINMTKKIGFNNINVDLMYALPCESIDELIIDLKFIESLNIEHVSCYSLIIEKNTKLYINNVANINEDLDYSMYCTICDFLKKIGFKHYEISNFAKGDYYSRHNTVYWENKKYYGFGLGASSYIDDRRIMNTRSINKYLNGDYVFEEEVLEKEDIVNYEIMLNLRKYNGVDLKELYNKYKVKINYEIVVDAGMVVVCDNRLFIPEDKWYISNEIIIKLLEGVVYE